MPFQLSITKDQVRMELKGTKARKATGSGAISSRVLRKSADQLSEVVQSTFDLSLSLDTVSVL